MSNLRVAETKARYAAEEKAALDAKVGPVINTNAALAKQIADTQNAVAAKYWSRPIGALCQQATIEDEDAVDDGFTFASGVRNPQGEYEANAVFIENLNAKGYSLSDVGHCRLMTYAIAHMAQKQADLSKVGTWSKAFDRLYRDLDAFADDEVGYEAPAPKAEQADPEVEPEVRPRLRTPSADRDESEIEQGTSLMTQWLSWMGTNFPEFVITSDVQRQVIDLALQKNWPLDSHVTFDAARRELFPELKTNKERADLEELRDRKFLPIAEYRKRYGIRGIYG